MNVAEVSMSEPMQVEAETSEKSARPFFYKVRPCKWIVMQQTCDEGDKCYFAHSPEELLPGTRSERYEAAQHWKGSLVAIGVVERALFWDVPPPGTTDVVCNRCSCLGNPFAYRNYGPDEVRPAEDDQGWCPGEHEYLCAAFGEYLSAVLDNESQDDLGQIIQKIAAARRLAMAETWMAQALCRSDIRRALETLGNRVANGERIRLLCHCRPHVRCHTELLKAHLETYAESGLSLTCSRREGQVHDGGCDHMRTCLWPGAKDFGPKCAAKKCWRDGRALDPGNKKLYCAQCWAQLYHDLKWLSDLAAGRVQDRQKDGSVAQCDNGQRPCRFFQRLGKCQYGEKCWYSHDLKAADQVSLRPASDVPTPMKRKNNSEEESMADT